MANTTADKLAKLNSTKAALKSAINGSGSTVGDVFSEYPTAITDGKSQIASAITDKGVSTSANATFQQMATNIGQISSNTLLEEIDSETFGNAIDLGMPGYLFVSNYGILPIVGIISGVSYQVVLKNEYVFELKYEGGESFQVSFEDDSMDFYFRSHEVYYGNNVFSEENIKFFVDALII